tara:strand:+ start:24 stop:1715 length:1692 start_codon:yes stop_codon:yes gene_type:complete
MSYRNPKIINDRSAEILAKGISQGVQNISKGIMAFGAEQRRNEILQKKEKQNLIKLQNEHSQSSAVFNAGLEGMSASMKAAMIEANEANLTRIDEIKVKQQGGNTDPKLSAELGILKTQIGSDVEFGKTVIGTTTLLKENREKYEKIGKTVFYKEELIPVLDDKTGEQKIDPDTNKPITEYSTARSVAIVDGFGGDPAYEADVYRKEGVLYARSKNKKTGKIFEIPASEFKTIADDFMIELPNSAEAVRKSILANMFDGTDLTGGALSNAKKSNATEVAADGDQIFYNVQTLDPAYIEQEKSAAYQSSVAAIEGTYGNRQAQQIQLVNYGIDPKKYNDLAKKNDEPGVANEEQQKLIRKRSNQNFDAALEQEGIVINKTSTTTGEGEDAVTTTTSSYEKRTKDPTKSLNLTEAQKKINVSNAKFNKRLNDSITPYETDSGQSVQENAATALNNLFEISGAEGEGKRMDINAGKKTYRDVKFKTNSTGQLVLNYKTGSTPGEETLAGQGDDSRSQTFIITDIGRLKNLLKNNFKMSESQLQNALSRFETSLKMDNSFFTSNSNN